MSIRKPNLKKLWRDIAETIQTDPRLEKVREAIELVRAERAECSAEERELLAEEEELARHPGRGSGVRLRLAGLLLLAVVLLAVDVPVQFALNASSLPQVPTWVWIVTAPAVALGLGALVHGAAVSYLYDRARPARSIRLCRTLSWVTFAAALIAGGVILYARVASASAVPYIIDLASVSIWVVAETLPVAAGLFLAWAHFLSVPLRRDRRLRRIQQWGARLDRFLDRLAAEEESLSGTTEESPPPGGNGGARSVAPQRGRRPSPSGVGGLLLALLIPLSTSTPDLHAQEAERACAVAEDATASVDGERRQQAVNHLVDGLGRLVSEFGCAELVTSVFTDAGRWTPRRWHQVPRAPRSRDCEAAGTVAVGEARGSRGLITAFSGFQRHFTEEAAERCRQRNASKAEAYDARWSHFHAGIEAELADPSATGPSHTDIVGLVNALAASGVTRILVATDGVDTVHEDRLPLQLLPGTSLVIVLIPSAPEHGGRKAADEAGRRWAALGPPVTVVPYLELGSPHAWERLAQGAGVRENAADSSADSLIRR